MRRLIVVIADGLRPEAVSPTTMPSLDALGRAFTLARDARTVRPSTTVAALASLATGVAPATHRLTEPGLGFLPRLALIRPVAWELRRHGIHTAVVTADLGPDVLPVAWTLTASAGARRLVAAAGHARQTAAAAQGLLARREEQVVFVYLPDCDRSGHAHGWMSQRYLEAARQVDACIGALAAQSDDTLLIVTADHGGGGVTATEHDEAHPLNERIPLVIAGPGVGRRRLTRPVSLLDVPATILWWFGVPVPGCYEGRPLADVFEPAAGEVEVAV